MTEESILSPDQVETILFQLEQKGLVFKTWDIKKQDYVWHMTESGNDLGKLLDKELNLHKLNNLFNHE